MSGASLVLPVLATVVAWWSATGAIAWLCNRPAATYPVTLGGATAVLAISLYWLHASAGDATPAGAGVAFAAALGAWSWLEITFLTGWLTGPRRRPCAAACDGPRHFVHAVQAILWHELAIAAVAALVLAATWHGPNRVGLLAFLVLWGMRTSAKLNLFFGVRNLGEAFLPERLRYLLSFFRRRPMNLLFPVSVTVGSWLAVEFADRALGAATPHAAAGNAMLATLCALAMLEHWLMVLPLPADALWRWSLRDRAGDAALGPRAGGPTPLGGP
jgi:putative photosynthetic complex assembly protein 2